MLRPPIFNKKFGNIRIKIWSYPKETLNCLINGLRGNSNTRNRVSDVVVFRHRFYEDSGGCNCIDKLENICFKYSSSVQRQGKLYVPIKLVNCEVNSEQIFISELRSIPEGCKGRQQYTRIIACEPNDFFECLIECPKERSVSSLNKCFPNDSIEIEQQREYYEKVIKELIGLNTSDDCESRKKGYMDKNSILELCLQNEVPTTKIVSLLREFEATKCAKEDSSYKECINCKDSMQQCNEDSSMCSNCNPSPSSSHPKRQNPRKRMFKIIPSSAPEDCPFPEDFVNDCPRQSTPDADLYRFSHLSNQATPISNFKPMRVNNQGSDFNKDIQEIKTILNDIITVIGCNETTDKKAFKANSIDLGDSDCGGSKAINIEDIRKALFQQLTPRKFDCNEKSESQKEYNYRKPDNDCIPAPRQNGQQQQQTYIPGIPILPDQIYARLPQTIPVIPGTTVPTLDALAGNGTVSPMSTFPQGPPEYQSRTDSTEHRLSATKYTPFDGTCPATLTDHGLKLPVNDPRSGVTNIYYYISSEPSAPAPTTPTPPLPDTKPPAPAPTPAPPDNPNPRQSHIIVDVNPPAVDPLYSPIVTIPDPAQPTPEPKPPSTKSSLKMKAL